MRSPVSVTWITQHIKQALERDASLQDVWVQGEVSNWFRSRAGHCYFTLKDERATMRAVAWQRVAESLSFVPQDGQSVLAHGHVSVYEPQGQYQFYVDTMFATGVGALYIRFEELKARLGAEGLFSEERKRPLAPFPAAIGVVTSAQGAAFRDICNVLSRRWPMAHVFLSPTLVQGEQAPGQIVAALQALYTRQDLDLIIVARGGGSIEDLWAFNDEAVARTIAASPVPVVSGIGHEVDFTIADFVADRRAPTPSAAAEVSVPDQNEVRERLSLWSGALEESAYRRLGVLRAELDAQSEALGRLSPLGSIDRERQNVDALLLRMDRAQQHRLRLLGQDLQGVQQRLRSLDPLSTLRRGYAVVRTEGGEIVRRSAQVSDGQRISVRVLDGSFGAVVRNE